MLGPIWSYKTGVLQCWDHCGVIRPLVYEYMGLMIRERMKLTFLVYVLFISFLPCVSFNLSPFSAGVMQKLKIYQVDIV